MTLPRLGQSANNNVPVGPRDAIRDQYERDQTLAAQKRKYTEMIKSDIISADVLQASYSRVSVEVANSPNFKGMNDDEAVLAKLERLFPFREGNFTNSDKYKALAFKALQFIKQITNRDDENPLKDKERELLLFLIEAERVANRKASEFLEDEKIV